MGRPEALRPKQERRGESPWFVLIAMGIAARFALSFVSFGSNDAAAWRHFAEVISDKGLIHTYLTEQEFNHPPLPGYWAAAALDIAGHGGTIWSDALFTNLFKLPSILADCLGGYLLWRIWRPRLGPRSAARIAAMFALSIDAIFVSGYHCNTDSIYVALCLLSLYAIEEKHSDFWGGFALGAAVNVKIIPALLVPVMLLAYRNKKRLGRFVAGLVIWTIPFLVPLVLIGKPFVSHVFAYNSLLDRWGVNFFLLLGNGPYFAGKTRAEHIAAWYYFHGKYFIVGAVLAWAGVSRVVRRWNRYESAFVSFSLLLIFAPGFGVQYTVLAGLLLFAIRPLAGAIYATVAGAFVAAAYWSNWTGTWPAMSQWTTLLPIGVALIGMATWLWLIFVTLLVVKNPLNLKGADSDAFKLGVQP